MANWLCGALRTHLPRSKPRCDGPGEATGMQRWSAENMPGQTGRTFVVTGANSGLGYVTTRELARHGAHVIMAVRDESRGHRAMDALRAEQPDANLELRPLDLSDLDS